MKRKAFLQGIGLAGIGSVMPGASAQASKLFIPPPDACTLIPSETAGPFPLDLTANPTFFRQDIRETQTGVILNLKMRIMGLSNCLPMANVRVNIWHCSKEGLYSGYSQSNNQGQAGLTYLRGYQMTDANGEVRFKTIFPGWYTGRICHIHFQVYVSSVYAAVSQLTFPLAEKNALYAANPSFYTKGADPLTYSTDNIFSDGYALQLASLTKNADGSYDSFLEVSVNGSGVLASLEPETGGQFKLGQNYPNPYHTETLVPFELTQNSDVLLEIFDLSAKKLAEIRHPNLASGQQQLMVNMDALGLPTGNYIYQLQVSNPDGVYRQCKMMTAGK